MYLKSDFSTKKAKSHWPPLGNFLNEYTTRRKKALKKAVNISETGN